MRLVSDPTHVTAGTLKGLCGSRTATALGLRLQSSTSLVQPAAIGPLISHRAGNGGPEVAALVAPPPGRAAAAAARARKSTAVGMVRFQ